MMDIFTIHVKARVPTIDIHEIFHRPIDNHVKTVYMEFYYQTLHNYLDIDVSKYFNSPTPINVPHN